MEVAYSEALHGFLPDLKIGPGVSAFNRLETRNWEILATLPALGSETALDSLRDRLRQLTGRRHIFFAPSGRAAIAQVLSLLPQREAVMPAYTCGFVKLSAQVAGKSILYTEAAPGSVNSTSAEFARHIQPGRVLIPTHIFGIPTDIENICTLARRQGCVTIEDAAAALGARNGQPLLGTSGDIGIYSFERSKRFPAFRGAAIVLNNENVISPGRLAAAEISGTHSVAPLREIAFTILYNLATTPWVYRRWVVPRRLRMYGGWNGRRPAPARTLEGFTRSRGFRQRFHAYQAALVLRMLARMNAIGEHIGRLVSVYRSAFRGSPVMTFLPDGCDGTTLLRFPIAVPGVKRSTFLRAALQRGLFLETNFETLLPDSTTGNEFPHALWVAQNVVLLPLYTSLSEESARRIAQEVARIAVERVRNASSDAENL